ncbi:MAG: GTPase RsgA [Clostridium sp.]
MEFTVLDETALEETIDKILPRKNVLIRPASANVDQALVVFAITQPDPNFNLLDRFLIMMLAQDIPVTICFNKTDLENGAKQQEYRSIYEQAGYPVMFVSTYEKSGGGGCAGLSAREDHDPGRSVRCGQIVPDQSSSAGGSDGDRKHQRED